MASPWDKQITGSRLKTYGKSSQNSVFFGSDKSATSTSLPRRRLNFSAHTDDSKANVKSTKSGELLPPGDSRTARGKIHGGRDIYDFVSSSDELNESTMPQRKRRKMDPAPEMPIRQKHRDEMAQRHPPPTEHKTMSDTKKRDPKKDHAPACEVVIRSPKNKRDKPSSGKRSDRLTDEGAFRKGKSTSATPPPLPHAAHSPSKEAKTPRNTTHSQPKSQMSKPAASTKPAQKARGFESIKEGLPAAKPTTDRPTYSKNMKTPERPALLSSDAALLDLTPSRKRLVDALYSNEPSEASSSESESETSPREEADSIHESQGSSQEQIKRPKNSLSRDPSDLGVDIAKDKGDLASPRSLQAGGPKVTYARQRSFLSAIGAPDDLSDLAGPEPSLLSETRSTKSGLSRESTLQKDVFSLPPDEDGDITGTGAVRNIYELRQAGGNARFKGMVDSIFEDLEHPATSRAQRHRGLLQLCSKLTDDQFVRRFLDNSQEKRFMKCQIDQGDIMSYYLIASALSLLLLMGPVSFVSLQTYCSQISNVIPQLIDDDRDILRIARSEVKLSGSDRVTLRKVDGELRQSRIWQPMKSLQPSAQTLALRLIELVVRRVRETGDHINALSDSILAKVVELVLQHSVSEEAIDAESGSFAILETSISILESYTVLPDSLDQSKERIIGELSRLGSFLARLSLEPTFQSRHLQMLGVRLILNLTNNKPDLCEEFSTRDTLTALTEMILGNFGMVSEEASGSDDRKDSLLDIVILALGALINLTEWSTVSRQLMLTMRRNSTTFLDCLLQLFQDVRDSVSKVCTSFYPPVYLFCNKRDCITTNLYLQADSVTQTHSNVAFGYLSVLLSTLSLDDEVRSHLKSHLNGKGLDRLLMSVEEFSQYHRKVEEDLQEEAVSRFTGRLQSILERIRQAESR